MFALNSEVIELTPSNFDDLVMQSNKVWVVVFYVPRAGPSQDLVPEYMKAAAALKGAVKVGAIDADKHKSLRDRFSVTSFPTITIFGLNKHSPTDLSGERTAENIVNAAMDEVDAKVKAQLEGHTGRDSGDFVKSQAAAYTTANYEAYPLCFVTVVLYFSIS